MKSAALCLAVLLLAGCSVGPQGYVSETRMHADGTVQSQVLSPYYEARGDLLDGRLHVHLICTQGKERLPGTSGLSIKMKDRMFNSAIEEVVEVYFINRTDQPLVIEDVRVSFFNGWIALEEPAFSVQPRQFRKSVAFAFVSHAYRAARKKTLSLRVNGELQQLELQERRTPLSEVPRR